MAKDFNTLLTRVVTQVGVAKSAEQCLHLFQSGSQARLLAFPLSQHLLANQERVSANGKGCQARINPLFLQAIANGLQSRNQRVVFGLIICSLVPKGQLNEFTRRPRPIKRKAAIPLPGVSAGAAVKYDTYLFNWRIAWLV